MHLIFYNICIVFSQLFHKKPAQDPQDVLPELFKNPVSEMLAIQMLSRDYGAPMRLTHKEADIAVGYMQEKLFKAGKMVLAEGQEVNVDYMLIVIDGDASVETIMVGQSNPMLLTVLGPGTFLGELGVIDQGPRSTTCTAASDLTCAVLTGESFQKLLKEHPAVGVKLLLLITKRMAERLRDTTLKLKLLMQLNKTFAEEFGVAD